MRRPYTVYDQIKNTPGKYVHGGGTKANIYESGLHCFLITDRRRLEDEEAFCFRFKDIVTESNNDRKIYYKQRLRYEVA